MQKIIVNGGRSLEGSVRVQGAKNAVLPILAATLLCEGEYALLNCPDISDVDNMLAILKALGSEYERRGDRINLRTQGNGVAVPDCYSKRLRASVLVAGPLLAKRGGALIGYPGGCKIGARPIGWHLDAFVKMGATVCERDGCAYLSAKKLKGACIRLPMPSVGVTEGVMTAAVLADGETEILNAAKEPEVCDLADFLRRMGADIRGAGDDRIAIRGGKKLKSVQYAPIGDRIAAGDILIATACVGGRVELMGVRAENLSALLGKLEQIGCKISVDCDKIRIVSDGMQRQALNAVTAPYPGFATDQQAQYAVLLANAQGSASITETVFLNRFGYLPHLKRMGAEASLLGNTLTVWGKRLHGAQVEASDLRSGAALVIAGLSAKGRTEISGVGWIDRGYESIESVYRSLGAEIFRR